MLGCGSRAGAGLHTGPTAMGHRPSAGPLAGRTSIERGICNSVTVRTAQCGQHPARGARAPVRRGCAAPGAAAAAAAPLADAALGERRASGAAAGTSGRGDDGARGGGGRADGGAGAGTSGGAAAGEQPPEQQQQQQQAGSHQHPHAARLARQLGVSAARAGAVLDAQPSLARLSPGAIQARIERLGDVFPGSQAALVSMVLKRPALVEADPRALRQRVQALASALRQPPGRVAAAALRQPSLLGLAGPAAAARLAGAAAALRLPAVRAGAAAVKQPLLLALDPPGLAARLAALGAALGMDDPSDVASMVATRPLLLGASPATLSAKLAALRSALGATRAAARRVARGAPQVLELAAPTAAARAARLRYLLGGQRGLLIALRREPGLLTCGLAPLPGRIEALRRMLGAAAAPAAAGRLAALRPSLLRRPPARLLRTHRALSVWRFEAGFKAALLQAHPSLLRLSPAEAHGRCRWLRALMMRSGHLHATLRRLPPRVLGALLLHLPRLWRRLQYLADSRQEGKLPLSRALRAPDAAFAEAFPDFARWRGWDDKQAARKMTPWRLQLLSDQRRQRQRAAARAAQQLQRQERRGQQQQEGGAAAARQQERRAKQQQQDGGAAAARPAGAPPGCAVAATAAAAAGGEARAAAGPCDVCGVVVGPEGAAEDRVKVGCVTLVKPRRPGQQQGGKPGGEPAAAAAWA
ncbi:MAG: hypothetical protein J3K34DRAFT_520967 [Monoraphidium minutum]|nr:MAG: hypothetical protein J3K34DRAFT_520967 [Monoraphidium minutum]